MILPKDTALRKQKFKDISIVKSFIRCLRIVSFIPFSPFMFIFCYLNGPMTITVNFCIAILAIIQAGCLFANID